MTRGSRGSSVYKTFEQHDIPEFPPTELVDSTGCGDTFAAAYLVGRLCGKPIADAGAFAVGAASKKLARRGPCRRTSTIERLGNRRKSPGVGRADSGIGRKRDSALARALGSLSIPFTRHWHGKWKRREGRRRLLR